MSFNCFSPMAPLARRRAVAILISVLIAIAGWAPPPPAFALPGLAWGDRHAAATRAGGRKPINPAGPSGHLQEVAAPGGVQQVRHHLAGHQPRLTLTTPNDGAVIQGTDWPLEFALEDWPLASDPDLGIGPHIAVQIDDQQPPLRFSEAITEPGTTTSRLQVTLPALSPGSHRLSAYAAYPWGEAVKSPGASLQWRLHQLQAMKGTQPEQDDPWLVMVSPSDLGSGEPLLLDWLVWNAPLQNLREGDGRWRLRLTVNGDSFLVDRQDAVWIRQSGSSSSQGRVQMELLDGLGEPIAPTFNNQLRAIPAKTKQRPVWLQSRLTDNELARLLGEPSIDQAPIDAEVDAETEDRSTMGVIGPDQQPAEAPSINDQLEATPTKASSPTAANSQSEVNSQSATDQPAKPTTTQPSESSTPEPSTAVPTPSQEPPSGAASSSPTGSAGSPMPTQQEERLTPASSLGGSARELVNPDGTQR